MVLGEATSSPVRECSHSLRRSTEPNGFVTVRAAISDSSERGRGACEPTGFFQRAKSRTIADGAQVSIVVIELAVGISRSVT